MLNFWIADNETQLALNAILIICGMLGTVINTLLAFFSLKSWNSSFLWSHHE